jgi:Flp pilus assembly protein TadD
MPANEPMRIPIAVALMLLLLPGCTDRKQASFDECHRIFVKPWPRMPEQLKLDGVDLCMKGEGYQRDEAACATLAALKPGCFRIDPHLLAMSVLTKPFIRWQMEREGMTTAAISGRLSRAKTLLEAGRYHDALAEYDAVIKLVPLYAPSHYGRGTALWRTGDLAGAKIAFDRAVALGPRNVAALFNRGYFRAQLNDLAGAVEDFSSIVALDPKNDSAYVSRGNAYSRLRNLENALSDYNAAQQLNPDSVWVYRGRGRVYQMRRDFDLARADYEQGLKLVPTDEWLINALAGLPPQQ